jgi:hypothetical protein
MHTPDPVDTARLEALRRVQRADTWLRFTLAGAAVVEALGLFGFFWCMNFKDPTHKLLLMQVALVYGTLSLGLIALGITIRAGTLRVLRALELLSEQRTGGPPLR